MLPAAGDLVRQIYPTLTDAKSVLSYPQIRGVSNPVFFMDHTFREMKWIELWPSNRQRTMSQKQSKFNPSEADLVIEFAAYLLR